MYAQDAWKATPRLTLNYGVRYEYYGVQHNNKANLDSNFYYGAGPGISNEIRNGQVFTVPNSPMNGAVAPTVGAVYGTLASVPAWWLVTVGSTCFAVGAGLHLAAQYALGRLRDG